MMHWRFVCNALLLLHLFFNYIETEKGIRTCHGLVKLYKCFLMHVIDRIFHFRLICSVYIITIFFNVNVILSFIFREYKNGCSSYFCNSAINMCESKSYKIYVFKLKLNAVAFRFWVHYEWNPRPCNENFLLACISFSILTLTINICLFDITDCLPG